MLSEIKPFGRLVKWIFGSFYDFYRFSKYGGWRVDLKNKEQRNYYSAKVYHSLEKSMSFTTNNPNSGWGNALLLVEVLEFAKKFDNVGFHDLLGYDVLKKFIDNNNGQTKNNLANEVRTRVNELGDFFDKTDEPSGTVVLSQNDLRKGTLIEPDVFFNSRYSVREFSERKVCRDKLNSAISLSLKTPSACNRQPWHVYHVSDKERIQEALSHQSGNRGFNDKIQDLLIVCSDIRAFNPGSERYQHWIDGGMYSMSLVYTLHSMGIASCCLNWSHQGKNDLEFRKQFREISHSHTIIMMIAIGEPNASNKLCISPRRPVEEIYSEI
ncbi:nitroreductase family protein [Providencia huaxiensis]|uniref:nitroreductase family protein n=1 Tax=Providencia huaxiensis TaxID=2027290 RepID=UPI0034E48CE2